MPHDRRAERSATSPTHHESFKPHSQGFHFLSYTLVLVVCLVVLSLLLNSLQASKKRETWSRVVKVSIWKHGSSLCTSLSQS